MASQQERAAVRVAEMDWSTFSDSLRGRTRGPGASANSRALESYFEPDELRELQELALHAGARSAAPKSGNVVFLHGIMGSNLATVDRSGDEDVVWVNLFRLVKGDIERLRLNTDGTNHQRYEVRTAGLDKRTYAKAVLWLQARWNVVPFAYDWRLDIDSASHALAECIKRNFPSQPVHLVAHSMGGLVSRNFIRLYPKVWAAMQDANGSRGGRLVMLGTPNYGSYAIAQAITGEEKLIRWLAAADLSHGLDDVLAILNSFVGSYEMLPAPSKLPAGAEALYRVETWKRDDVSRQHLDRSMQFHADLAQGNTIDKARMAYVAGSGRETLSGITLLGGGEFLYTTTPYGDGRVPHSLGLLDGVPTFYVDEVHGDLPRNQRVMAAVDDLLETGRTSALPVQPPPIRALADEGVRWRRPVRENVKARELQYVAEKVDAGTADEEEVRRAEDEISRAVAGRAERADVTATIAAPPAVRKTARAAAITARAAEPDRRIALEVELRQADVAGVGAPVLVVGHYKGVTPINAVGALDRALDGWILEIQKRGIMSADLGEVFFIPTPGSRLGTDALLLAGMGEPGHFTRDDLRFLMSNVTYAIGMLGISHFASVLVGSGAGNLSRDLALRTFLAGVADGIGRLPDARRTVRKVILIEKYHDACRQLADMLKNYALPSGGQPPETSRSDDGVKPWFIPGLNLKVKVPRRYKADPKPKSATDRQRSTDPSQRTVDRGPRITIECEGGRFRFSAMTNSATVPVREVTVKPKLARDAAAYLRRATSADEHEKYGRLLATYLMPEDFQSLLERGPLTLVLDRATAAYPWEMACVRGASGVRYFGTTLQLSRQFRTMLSRPVGTLPQGKSELHVLVIADPAEEPELQLPGARAEGRAVVQAIEAAKRNGRRIDVVSRIGAAECDPVEILALILSGDYDIIHFAGHGVFDEKKPNESGWVFGWDCILSPSDIFQARRVPYLVFANACFSAGIKERAAMGADETDKRLAGLAEAFFERGVRNYIGTGWPVDDQVAVELAKTFYEKFLDDNTLAYSLAEARAQAQKKPSSTWGAYQHYGWANEVLPAVDGGGTAAKASRPSRKRAARRVRKPSRRARKRK